MHRDSAPALDEPLSEAAWHYPSGAPKKVAAAPAWLSVLDDPTEWDAFGQPLPAGPGAGSPARWQSRAVIEGMHCAACALTIEEALRQVPGVERAEVSAATGRAKVTWNSASTRPSQWFAAVQGAGYSVFPASDTLVREAQQAEQRMALWRWLVAGFCMMQVMMYAVPGYVAAPGEMTADMALLLRWASWVLTLPVVLFACKPFFANAWRDLRHRRIGMDLPVALGMAIAFAVSTAGTFDPSGPLGHEVYFDSLTMFVFFLLTGRWLEGRLRDRTAGALDALVARLPETVQRRGADGAFEQVAVRRLRAGDRIRVLPGEAFPADGTVCAGSTLADEALLTGESRPVARPCGSRVLAGSHNLSAAVEVAVEQAAGDTRFAQIVSLMESAASHKPPLARLADRVARPFLVLVLCAAALSALWWWTVDPGRALMVAAAVLVATCPCALSLATPSALLAAAGTTPPSPSCAKRLPSILSAASLPMALPALAAATVGTTTL
jgi:Cu2+-exporting ATPase